VIDIAVILKFLGSLRHASGNELFRLDYDEGASLLKIIDRVTENMPELRRSLLEERLEKPKPNALIIVNGREISVLSDLDTQISDGDEIVFVPVVHGG
jgi:MoaD family protein